MYSCYIFHKCSLQLTQTKIFHLIQSQRITSIFSYFHHKFIMNHIHCFIVSIKHLDIIDSNHWSHVGTNGYHVLQYNLSSLRNKLHYAIRFTINESHYRELRLEAILIKTKYQPSKNWHKIYVGEGSTSFATKSKTKCHVR